MKNLKKYISVALSCLAFICLLLAGILFIRYIREDKIVEDIAYELHNNTPSPSASTLPLGGTPLPTDPPSPSPKESQSTASPAPTLTPVPAIENPYAQEFIANEDMVGWLYIPGTNINYPVMWTPEDENFYLYRDFHKNDNTNGSLILDTDSSLNPLTTNLIIHGHNMKSGAMFGNLTNYEDENYYQEHRQIILHTKECQRNYEIIAVFRSQVFKKSDHVFKFYQFFQADSEAEFSDFYENIKSLSLYETDVTAEFGDRFITLSTCVYHVKNGRFVVVAKEIQPGDSYLPIHSQ